MCIGYIGQHSNFLVKYIISSIVTHTAHLLKICFRLVLLFGLVGEVITHFIDLVLEYSSFEGGYALLNYMPVFWRLSEGQCK